jgi:hypothetical protein
MTIRFLSGMPAELTQAARRLAATPLFTIFAVLSLAIGVAVTTVAYSIVESMFFRLPGVREADRIAFIATPANGGLTNAAISYADFVEMRAARRAFASLSATAPMFPVVGSGAASEVLPVEAVDGAYFSTFGVTAAIGRTIGPQDDTGVRIAVLSDWIWRTRFARDPAIVGRTVRIAAEAFEVIGVADRRFEGAAGVPATRLWIPLAAEPAQSRAPAAPRSLRDPGRSASAETMTRPASLQSPVAVASIQLATALVQYADTCL